ncbi:SNF2-related protein [Sphingobium sp. WCS2017Hpa-17]|uniref:DEAD/DEAH box helicase n=1 Tax=Sphingobium sp. WCS2017Hpa-17 TaxID=3073638 RepID=UPI002889183E|nr:SNF2-related protein [Sphingobium sp. WCS2017Hpa-17]
MVNFHANGQRLSLVREIPSRLPFGKASREIIPFDDWVLHRPDIATAAIARLLQAYGDGEVAADGEALVKPNTDGTRLHPALIARLSDSEAQALGLPLATRLALTLRSSGLIQRDSFRIDTHWSRMGGVTVRAALKDGFLRQDGRDWRIPEPLYSTLVAVEAVNAASDDASRQRALADLKQAIGEEGAANIRPDGLIDRLRLAYASGLSLQLRTSGDGFDFDPVLFARDRVSQAEDGAVLDEATDSLLPPALATGFARRFRNGDGRRRTYLLDDGSLLYIDPQLSEALAAVRVAQAGGAEQRRAFATAPERHIGDALRSAGHDPADVPRLFIETQQFSERVAGIDVWRKPVLPWIKPKPDSWLPESFGLRIGEEPDAHSIPIAPDDAAFVTEMAQQAVREERASFRYEGQDIPATQATVTALERLVDLVTAAGVTDTKADIPPPMLRQRFFLQVRDNLDDVVYAPLVRDAGIDTSPAALPTCLRSTPKPHQLDGFQWLVTCRRAGLPGALLADDMGLGKTFQALAFLAWLRSEHGAGRPVLIVAPTGLLENWRAEINRHLEPDALGRVVDAHGAALTRLRGGAARDIDSGDSAIDPAAWAQAGVVLTTYETMRDYHMSLARQPFAAILYDEAQKLKNPASQVTRAAKTLNAAFQLAMTGTPVENRLQDLWSVLDVVHPGLLGSSRQFEESYPAEPEALQRLHALLTQEQGGRPPVLLRRMKDDCLAGLPAKHIRALPLNMPPLQAQAYDRAILRAMVVKGSGERGRMLEVLHQLRGVSLHPLAPEQAGSDAGYFEDSARIATLFSLLHEISAKREKVLIFCESLAMQALLAAEIARRFNLSHTVERIHGGVAGKARQAAVDRFQSRGAGFDAMLLSPKAGGVGLTLTAANHVIHLSRWWNPAVEDQATDRAYRIGQDKDVTVYLPQSVHPDPAVAPTSFDLKLHALMERKRALSRGLLAPAEDENDAGMLFDGILGDSEEDVWVSEAAEQPSPPVAAPEPPAPPAPRSILRPRVVASPPPPAPVAPPPTWPQRVVYQPGGARDYRIFKGPIEADPVRELRIVDPYGAAGARARQNVVDFARMLLKDGQGVDSVQLITADTEFVDVDPPENDATQYGDMHDRWQRTFGRDVPLQFIALSKRGNSSLHDREVQAVTRSGRTLIWDLGRGIDAVMHNRHQCRVVLTTEP